MNDLPTHLGGYQHLEPFAIARNDDIYVARGHPMCFVQLGAGKSVGELESATDYNIYRKMPVAKQSDSNERDYGMRGTVPAPIIPLPSAFLPTDAKARKATPIYSGFLKYFPLAIAEVARVSRAGNDQHNPGKPLHWDRSKSGDELDALSRHLLEAGKFDTDGQRHSAKLAWRALASLQKELEEELKTL